MQPSVREKILLLNTEFYQRFGQAFADTRARIQPGVQRAIQSVPDLATVLDVGCGNGNLAQALAQQGHRGRYVGIDASQALLRLAQEHNIHPEAQFFQADLADPGWVDDVQAAYDWVLAFAVLHHLPDASLRLRIMRQVRTLLASQGSCMVSTWRFLQSPRLRARIVPWEAVDLRPDQLDPGDYLLDWRRGGYGLRYVHAFEEHTLAALAQQANFEVVETYFSDGKEGNLGLYQKWQPA